MSKDGVEKTEHENHTILSLKNVRVLTPTESL